MSEMYDKVPCPLKTKNNYITLICKLNDKWRNAAKYKNDYHLAPGYLSFSKELPHDEYKECLVLVITDLYLALKDLH